MSKAVREHLYDAVDRNAEWNKIQHLQNKGDTLLTNLASTAKKYQGSSSNVQGRSHMTGEESLNVAREKLEDAVKQGNLTKDLQRSLAEIKSVLKLYNEL
jgi:HPt (histidine-containing phosphotransfer) domain-containing protein